MRIKQWKFYFLFNTSCSYWKTYCISCVGVNPKLQKILKWVKISIGFPEFGMETLPGIFLWLAWLQIMWNNHFANVKNKQTKVRFSCLFQSIENCLYALGGFDSTNYQASVERLDPRMGKWAPVPSMSSRRSSCGVAALDGAIYCVGGNDGTMCMSSGERFNVRRNSWEPIAPMLSRRYVFVWGYYWEFWNILFVEKSSVKSPQSHPSSKTAILNREYARDSKIGFNLFALQTILNSMTRFSQIYDSSGHHLFYSSSTDRPTKWSTLKATSSQWAATTAVPPSTPSKSTTPNWTSGNSWLPC